MAALLALENYAKSKDPSKELGKDLYLVHDEKTLTIYDCYPKAKYHFLIMPRLPSAFPEVPASSLSSLRSLLSSSTVPRSKVVEVLEYLRDKAEDLKKIIEERMVKEEGFKWDIQVGFHASESMKHLHLHVISTDFQSDRLKHKKHWNSFHPELGFFLHLSDLLENLAYPEYTLKTKITYEMKLKDPLICHVEGCEKEFSTFPALKKHVTEEWEKRKKEGLKEKTRVEKRKAEEAVEEENSEKEKKDRKRQKTEDAGREEEEDKSEKEEKSKD